MARPYLILLSLLATGVLVAQDIHEVRPINLGNMAEDYAPVLLDSGFVMCSIRETSSTISFKDAETGKPLADLYWVPLRDGVPGQPVLLSANLATPVNEGPSAFTDQQRTICFTRNLVLPKKLSNLRASNAQLGLFFSTVLNEVWSSPTPFEHNSSKFSVMHPAFTADGNTLIFSSDMPGGYGGMDLYRSERTTDGWSLPVNLGPMVNGPANDAFPSFGPDGTLYFSSDREGGMGKLDLYASSPQPTGWSDPTSMPAPMNSAANDISLTFRPDGRSGFFSSDRSGSDRIMSFNLTVPKFRDCSPQQLNNYCYSFKGKPHAATSTLPLDHVWDLGDGTLVNSTKAEHCYTVPGRYTARSLLVDRKTGATFHQLKELNVVAEDFEQAWIAAPDTVRTGRTLALDAFRSHLPDMAPGETHWDLGDGSLQTGRKVLHTYRSPGTYEVKLDILSKPDANGVIHNRCNTRTIVVIDRFRDQEDMAVVATYQDARGKTHSFEFQELPADDMSMTADGMADVVFAVELFASKERVSLDDPKFVEIRKHYRVVERFDPVRAVYTYSVGETKNIEELYKVFQKVKELQFMDAEVHQLKIEKLMDLSTLDFASLQDLDHTKLRTNAIHFAFKSAELGEGSDAVLEQLTGLLRQHPELELVIEAHTDDIGSTGYNIELSQQRAQNVQAYLEAQGVSGDRLVPIGHGKNQPIASNRTEEGRSLNRRVEFRMTVKGDRQQAGDPRSASALPGR